ncbi:MAG TPA: ferritin [Anaerolineales bacterium]|jgi:ferritin|nr:ferritin [Anaerolineales bacterium]
MLISNALEQAINDQIGREFGANLQYVNIASYFDADDLPELASFFYRQAEEEKMHAMKFVKYIIDAGGQVRIPSVEGPKYNFESPEEAVNAALDWELEVTKQINALMDMAIKENDHIAQDFLRWFVTEQLEEVSTMETLLNVVRRAKDNILWVEDYLARNPIVPETGEAAA